MNLKIPHLFLTLSLLFPMSVGIAVAAGTEQMLLAAAEQAGISENEAAVIAAKASGGQVISSETNGTAGVTVYSFKVLMSDGRVKNIKVNAKTGDVL